VDSAAFEEWAARSQSEDPPSKLEPTNQARRSIGEYELLSRISQGAMGIVYRAWPPGYGGADRRMAGLVTAMAGGTLAIPVLIEASGL
jgi:hypothetical protein